MDTSSQLPCQIAQALWPFNSRGDRVFGGLPICDAAQMTGRSVGRWDILSGRHRVWVEVRCAAGSATSELAQTARTAGPGTCHRTDFFGGTSIGLQLRILPLEIEAT